MNHWTITWRQFLQEHPLLDIPAATDYFPVPAKPAAELAVDESFWQQVKAMYRVSTELINLNSGGVSSSPHIVENAFVHYYQMVNTIPSYFLFKYMEQGRELIREGLASLINCSKEEVAMLRNATEGLNNVIFGMDLKAGDEVVACKQDYSKGVSSWKQRALREGIIIKWVNLAGAGESDEEVIAKYADAFSDKTKVLHLTHVINWNGQTLPVEKIIREAKKRNIEVLLDGAHSFALLETDMQQLGCDYFVTALHKWLSGPIPSGMLYVKKSKIHQLWPLASSFTPQSDDIRKFEELSIQLMPTIIGMGYAIEYYTWLGRANKEERLRYLRRFWTSQVEEISQLRFHTPHEEARCCVMVNVKLLNREPVALEKCLLEQYKIHVTAVTWENMQGIRVTPNVYTDLQELESFTKAIKEICLTV